MRESKHDNMKRKIKDKRKLKRKANVSVRIFGSIIVAVDIEVGSDGERCRLSIE